MVTLLSSTNSPVAGKAVSLVVLLGRAVVGAPSPATTGSNGQVSFSLTDSVAETVTLTATDTTDGITLTSQARRDVRGGSTVGQRLHRDRLGNDLSGGW